MERYGALDDDHIVPIGDQSFDIPRAATQQAVIGGQRHLDRRVAIAVCKNPGCVGHRRKIIAAQHARAAMVCAQ